MKARVWRSEILLLLASTAVALGSAEIALRSAFKGPSLLRDPDRPLLLHPDPAYIPGVSGLARVRASELGVRADSLTARYSFRLIAMGGSTTECIVLDASEAWPAIVQSLLTTALQTPVWVGNAGVSGHSSRHHVMQIGPLLDIIDGVDAILLLVGVNDVLRALRQTDDPTDWYEDPRERVRAHYEAFAIAARPSFGPIWERSELVHAARRARQTLRLARLRREETQANPGNAYHAARTLRRGRPMISELPDLTQARIAYRRNLERVIDVAEAREVEVVLVTHPALWQEDLAPGLDSLLWLGEKDPERPPVGPGSYTASALSRGLQEFNAETLDICADHELSCFDLAAALPSDTTVFYDDVHFNEQGARAVAGALAPFLAEVLRGR